MDFIEDRPVKKCWEYLSGTEHMDIVIQVAFMITILQFIPVLQ